MAICGFSAYNQIRNVAIFRLVAVSTRIIKNRILLNSNNINSGGTMKRFLKNVTIIVMLISLSFLTVSCNTMQGLGKDLEAAGEKIQEKAD
ncbi:MAG: entericidin A/B family lipoprotein [Desulfotignum sp.]